MSRDTQRWLVDELWGASSVGVIGGAPKCAKTWLGLDMALSVATGTACLGKYAVPQPGPVLVYLAEDALPVVRERIEGMARHRGLDLGSVEIHVITAPVLRLDRDRGSHAALGDNQAASASVAAAGSIGETSRHRREQCQRSGRVAWRTFARCSGSSTFRCCWCITRARTPREGPPPEQGLRGSSDIHAFGDSNLYLRRGKEHLVLSTEHRAAAASPPIYLDAGRDQSGHNPPGGRRRERGKRRESSAASRSECWTLWPAAWCSHERSSVTASRSRTSVWARCWSRSSALAG